MQYNLIRHNNEPAQYPQVCLRYCYTPPAFRHVADACRHRRPNAKTDSRVLVVLDNKERSGAGSIPLQHPVVSRAE